VNFVEMSFRPEIGWILNEAQNMKGMRGGGSRHLEADTVKTLLYEV